MRHKRRINVIDLAKTIVPVLAIGCTESAPSLSLQVSRSSLFTGRYFGVECQETYENDWLEEIDQAWDRCSGFKDKMDDTDYSRFYYDLNGAAPYWQDSNDSAELDNVELLFASTHGGTFAVTDASYAMWNNGVRVYSGTMRLGDDATKLKIFSTWSCHTLDWRDGHLWDRMYPIFSGGLIIATGSQDILISGPSTDEVGNDYAENLQNGYTVNEAWHDVLNDWIVDNDGVVMATGNLWQSCTNRLNNFKWATTPWPNLPILRDFAISEMCLNYWFDL